MPAIISPNPPSETARTQLRDLLAPGMRLFTVVCRVSRSGASAEYDVVYIDADSLPVTITVSVARALGLALTPWTPHLTLRAIDLPANVRDVETAGACLVADLAMTLYGDPAALDHGNL